GAPRWPARSPPRHRRTTRGPPPPRPTAAVLPSACPPAGSAPHRPDADSASALPTPVLVAPALLAPCPLSCPCPPASGPTLARVVRPRRSLRQCSRRRQQCPERLDRPCESPRPARTRW